MTPTEIDIIEERHEELLLPPDQTDARGTLTLSKTAEEPSMPLFAQKDAQEFRTRWEKIQTGFVDDPRKAVEQADALVAGTIKRLEEVFAAESQKLESEWGKTDNVSTEELRVALRRYRSFFDRLLSV